MWPPSRKTFKHFHYQMQDWNPRLSGISSFFPQSFYALRDQMATCPGHDCFHALKMSKADIFIVRLPALNPKKLNLWSQADLSPYGFSLQPQSSRRIMVWLRDVR